MKFVYGLLLQLAVLHWKDGLKLKILPTAQSQKGATAVPARSQVRERLLTLQVAFFD